MSGNPSPEHIETARIPTDSEVIRASDATNLPRFPPPQDFAFLDKVIGEYYGRSNAKVLLLPLASALFEMGKGTVAVDPLYGTIEEVQVDKKTVKFEVNSYVKIEPSKQILKRFGIDEQRDILFTFQLSELTKLGLVREGRYRGVDIGWLVIFDETQYEITSVHRGGFFANTNQAHFVVCPANRYRRNNNPLGGQL